MAALCMGSVRRADHGGRIARETLQQHQALPGSGAVCRAWPLLSRTGWSCSLQPAGTGRAPALSLCVAVIPPVGSGRSKDRQGLWQAMRLTVFSQAHGQGKGPSAALKGAGKGPVFPVSPAMPVQGCRLREAASAALPGAGIGFFSAMGPRVDFQGGQMREGLSAIRVKAGKGPLAAMDPPVYCQVVAPGKGLSAVRGRAGKGPVAAMDPLVCFQG